MTWLDDHSRYALSVTARNRVTGAIVLATFRKAAGAHGIPASTPTGNGMVLATRFSGGKGGCNGLEHELRRLGITQKNGKPNHPQTQGKAERFWQTLKNWLAAQNPQPADLAALQALLDAFTTTTPAGRTSRCRARPPPPPPTRPGPKQRQATAQPTPTTASAPTAPATPASSPCATPASSTTGTGRTHVIMLVQDLHIRIIHAATGELLRQLTLDPTRDYQPTGKPRDHPRARPDHPAKPQTPNPGL